MGVPAFFRWLTEKYPKILTDVLEERCSVSEDGVVIPPDASLPNPDGFQCDNLYIDMNGIIHPCAHPEHGPQPKTEGEMYVNVCKYVDRLFNVVRPRRLLYLAIDGVAPRSKCNQQRARRFRTAQEVREKLEVEKEVIESLWNEAGEQKLFSSAVAFQQRPWDSNVITPGTPFMLNLASFLRFYIRKRISTHPAWKNIKVIFSDASIPGEGEHKIMAHIRQQRAQPGYDPNAVHVLHGLDADLIMLALATHEAHFYILREEVVFGRRGAERLAQHREASGFATEQRKLDERGDMDIPENKSTTLQRLSIPVLREYLQAEFSCLERLPFRKGVEISFERIIDDFVFLCFFVGNDFLPHLPSLDIRDGALDFLINVYKRILPTLGDYITNHGGEVNLSHVDVILAEVGAIEDHVFTMRYQSEQADKSRRNNKRRLDGISNKDPQQLTHAPVALGKAARALQTAEHRKGLIGNTKSNGEMIMDEFGRSIQPIQRKISAAERTLNALKSSMQQKKKIKVEASSNEENSQAASELKLSLLLSSTTTTPKIKIDQSDHKTLIDDVNVNLVKEELCDGDMVEGEGDDVVDDDDDDDVKSSEDEVANAESDEAANVESDEAANVESDEAAAKAKHIIKMRVEQIEQKRLDELSQNVQDNIRLHEKGWKERYYSDKFKADDIEGNGGRENLYRSYVMGLVWVMKYYYSGVCSWRWYYPFHYAPFASDLRNIERFAKDCQSFEISEPFSPVEQLMAVLPSDSSHAVPKASRWLMCDPESPIIDFYPKDVPCDPNGKAMPWLWVVLLPFIEEKRLLEALRPTMSKWSATELLCNSRGLDDGYIYVHVEHPLAERLQEVKIKKGRRSLGDPARWGGFSGSLQHPLSQEQISPGELVEPPKISASNEESSVDLTSPLRENMCLCAAFTEPLKRPHKSIMLMGAIPPPPSLQSSDFVTRRPRLNFGGPTIANLGGFSLDGQSVGHGLGHGSIRSGQQFSQLGHQVSPAGGGHPLFQPPRSIPTTRENIWQQAPQHGNFYPNPPSISSHTQQQHNFQQGTNFQSSYPPQYGNQTYNSGVKPTLPQQRTNFTFASSNGNKQHRVSQDSATNRHTRFNQPHYNQQSYASTQPVYQQLQPIQSMPFQQVSGAPLPASRAASGFSFNRNGEQRQRQTQAPPSHLAHSSPVNPSLLNSLRSQLASTLQQNRRRQDSAKGDEKR